MGKYLALVTVFAIPMAVMCTYPLIMSKFGTISYKGAYTRFLGSFFLDVPILPLRILFINNRKPGDRSSAYVCIFVCILYDEWDFLILFTDSTFYMYCIWLPDSCTLYHYLYYD